MGVTPPALRASATLLAANGLIKPLNQHIMSYYVKSLKLTFEREVSENTCDDYGYPMKVWYKHQYSVTVTSPVFRDIAYLYKCAMREFHNRYGKLIRVQSIFELVVTPTNIHVVKANLDDCIVIDEDGNEILCF